MGVRLYFHFYFYLIIHIYLSKIYLPIYMFLYSLMSFTFFPMYAKMNHSLRMSSPKTVPSVRKSPLEGLGAQERSLASSETLSASRFM